MLRDLLQNPIHGTFTFRRKISGTRSKMAE